MSNDSTKHRPLPTDTRPHHPSKPPEPDRKPSAVDFLIDTNILPFVLVGKGVRCFGWGAVAAFILGGLSVYGYAIVRPLPYAKVLTESVGPSTPATSPQPKMVRLRGVVRDANLRPVTERFWVGVLANQLGPVQNPEGAFVLEVPQSNTYDVALWTSQESVSFYNRIPAEQDDKGLRLQESLPFLTTVRTADVRTPKGPSVSLKNEIARSFSDR